MYTLTEEITVLIYLILYGVYLFSTLDIVNLIVDKIKKLWLKILIQIIYWLVQTYITYLFSYRLMNGYVPIYFILFIYGGYYLYTKIFKKSFTHIINELLSVFKRIFLYIIKIIKPLLYSKQLFAITKKVYHHYKKILVNTFKKTEENTEIEDKK